MAMRCDLVSTPLCGRKWAQSLVGWRQLRGSLLKTLVVALVDVITASTSKRTMFHLSPFPPTCSAADANCGVTRVTAVSSWLCHTRKRMRCARTKRCMPGKCGRWATAGKRAGKALHCFRKKTTEMKTCMRATTSCVTTAFVFFFGFSSLFRCRLHSSSSAGKICNLNANFDCATVNWWVANVTNFHAVCGCFCFWS